MEKERNEKRRKIMEERECAAVMDFIEAKFFAKTHKKLLKVSPGDELWEMAVQAEVMQREMEKKWQRLATKIYYLERAKREEAPLVEAAYQQRLVEEQLLHECGQQLEVGQSRQCHGAELQEKNRLARMWDDKVAFQERVMKRRVAEYARLRQESAEEIRRIRLGRQLERLTKRKMIFYLKTEEERRELQRHEEERRTKEAASKQRQRDLELQEKQRLEKQQARVGATTSALPAHTVTRPQSKLLSPAADAPSAPTKTAPARFAPRHQRENGSASSSVQSRPFVADNWHNRDDRSSGGKWRSNR